MSNFILSDRCNAHCAFCFASAWLKRGRDSGAHMSRQRFAEYLEFVQRGGLQELRLLGGEPSIHPLFAEFVQAGRERGLHITVFSNGVMPRPALRALCELSAEDCSVVINMNAEIAPAQYRRKLQVLEELGERVVPGYTITSPVFSLQPLIESIGKFGLKPLIRLGLSQPVVDSHNLALHPKQYPQVGQAILAQSRLCAAEGIKLDADCGFVRCMFPPQAWQELLANGFIYRSSCDAILDMCGDGKILSCFALSALSNTTFTPEKSMAEVRAELESGLEVWRGAGVYPECSQCAWFHTQECCGGCLSAVIRRFRAVSRDEYFLPQCFSKGVMA